MHEVGYSLAVNAATKGSSTYRIYRPATATNAAGFSKPVRLRIT